MSGEHGELKDHEVHRHRFILAVGTLSHGFIFYGPFDTSEKAETWGGRHIRNPLEWTVQPIGEVRDV
jgi:hypothetical protein